MKRAIWRKTIPVAAVLSLLWQSAAVPARADDGIQSTNGLGAIGALSATQQDGALNKLYDGRFSLAPSAAVNAPRALPGGARWQAANFAQPSRQQEMQQNLTFIEAIFKSAYAQADWKERHVGWDFDKELAQARAEVAANPGMSFQQYHKVLKKLFASTQDYHVSIHFAASEVSRLPVTLQGTDGHYFLAYVDRKKLPKTSFPFEVGDEVVSFDGKPVKDVIAQLKADMGSNIPSTDDALASLYLTARSASSGMDVPQGPVTIAVKGKDAKQSSSYQLIWDHTPEAFQAEPGFLRKIAFHDVPFEAPAPRVPFARMADMRLSFDVDQEGGEEPKKKDDDKDKKDKQKKELPNPYGLGVRESFLPELGPKIWESADDNPFQAYVYRSPKDGKIIGYVRIPSYVPENYRPKSDSKKSLAAFAEIIQRFDKTTDALVIDQLNNPGGSLLYLYGLASMLSDQTMAAPRHRVAITQSDAAEAAATIRRLESVSSDEDAKKALGMEDMAGLPVTYEMARHLLEFSRFILNEWNKGHTLTDPTFLYAMDSINPRPDAHYTKPILVLTNALDFSGGDFFPTILQDNHRATIFGQRTAGAGGFIRQVQYPNQVGVSGMVVTGSIAERVDKNPIENLGVTPDVGYAVTQDDLKGKYSGYAKAVNDAVSGLLATKGEKTEK